MDLLELELPEIIELSELGYLLIDNEHPDGEFIDWQDIANKEIDEQEDN